MKTIARIAWSNNKKNKIRSVLIMAAIFLSTILLTVICTCANWLIRTGKANAARDYGSYYGMFRNVEPGQLDEIKRRGEFSQTGLVTDAGYLKSDGRVSFVAMDENAREFSNTVRQFIEGNYPKTENEIAAQKEFFAAAGYEDVHVGDLVQLEYRPDLKHKYEARTFSVSGICQSQPDQKAFLVLGSHAFVNAQYKAEEHSCMVPFRLGEDVQITTGNAEEVIKELAAECGIAEKNVVVNAPYLMLTLDTDMETLGVSAGIVLVVILFSVIIIYNIFQVGIAQNIREYGKIRALGAGKKQMRRLILQEGLSLAGCSIPPGILAGYLISWAGLGWMTGQTKAVAGLEPVKVRVFSLPMLLVAAGLALFTVLLALRRPMKIAGRLSPVDALRYTERTGSSEAGFRKGRTSMSVYALAAANISANKKRTVMTILTMGLSCVLFVILSNCVSNMDTAYEARNGVEYGQFQIELNYYMDDEAYPEHNLDMILKQNPLNQTLIQKIQAIDGVTEIKTRDILVAQINGKKEDVAVLDEESFTKTKKRSGSMMGELDYEQGTQQDCFYYGWLHFLEDSGYYLDQQLTAEFTNGRENTTVNGRLAGVFAYAPANFVITEGMYQRMGLTGASTGWLWADCRPEDVPEIRAQLEQLLSGLEYVGMTVYEQELDIAETSIRMMKAICYLFLIVLGLIGFMNLANTMIMNIITKKQEYGILQAVGMTNRQLNASLQLQGLLFSGGTVLVAVLGGLPAGYAVFRYARAKGIFGLNVYHIPAAEIVGMVVVIGLLQALLSFLLSRNLKKESLVDRIRYQE